MKNQKLIAIICGVLLCILMIASDYHGYTTERSVVEFISGSFLDLNDNEKQLAQKYMDENCGIGVYSYGIFQKEDWGKFNIDYLKNF